MSKLFFVTTGYGKPIDTKLCCKSKRCLTYRAMLIGGPLGWQAVWGNKIGKCMFCGKERK